MSRASVCPCTSGEPYARCCAPYHLGAAEADTPTALMRSRFAAFARADVNYLYRTLHPDHPDRAAPEAQVRRAIAESARAHRYMGLAIHDARGPDDHGVAQVLFHARVFEKGRERSFTECSDFARDGGGWRYLRGVLRPGAPAVTRIDAFLAG